jgi:hypothetical protein
MGNGILITELIDELQKYAKLNPKAMVKITDSPFNQLEILSIYSDADTDEDPNFETVYIDVGNEEDNACSGCSGCSTQA